jgi:growth arrest-specific protein 8
LSEYASSSPQDVLPPCVACLFTYCACLGYPQDKINAFWEITKKEMEDKKAEVRNKDREMEEMEERHQVEIKVYKQKVKHLLYEHQNNLAFQKADVEYALKLQQGEFRTREEDLEKDRRRLKREVKEHEFADQQHVLEMQRDHAKEITKLRQVFELQVRCRQLSFELPNNAQHRL